MRQPQKKGRPEFTWVEQKKLWKKQIKNPQTGKWVAVYAETQAELRDKLRDKEEELAAAMVQRSPYVYEYAAKWYELHTAALSASGKQSHKNAINNHICPVIGNLPIDSVKPDDIRAVMQAAADLSRASQQKIATTLKMIFAAAEDNGMIERSPCRVLKPGGSKPTGKTALTKAQQERLISALTGTRILPFVELCLYAGLRREEALGLKWDCVTLTGPTPHISVRRALRWEHNQPIISDALKSSSAKRDIPIPPRLADLLRQTERVGALVCCRRDGSPHTSISFRREWEAVSSREERIATYRDNKHSGQTITRDLKVGDTVPYRGIEIAFDYHVTPHILRHTYITELILAGVNVKTVQYLAGHATAAITLNIYTHLLDNRPEQTAAAVLSAFDSQDTNQDTGKQQA